MFGEAHGHPQKHTEAQNLQGATAIGGGRRTTRQRVLPTAETVGFMRSPFLRPYMSFPFLARPAFLPHSGVNGSEKRETTAS